MQHGILDWILEQKRDMSRKTDAIWSPPAVRSTVSRQCPFSDARAVAV